MEVTSTLCAPRHGAFRGELGLDAAALGGVRSGLREYLAARRVPGRAISDVVLCVQEAVTNALRFGHGGRVEVAVWVEADEVCARVRDHGQGFSMHGSPCRPDAWRTEGRGLFLICALMDQVMVEGADGAVVCMRRKLLPRKSDHAA